MSVLRPGMGGRAPRKVKAKNTEQSECFEKMRTAAETNDIGSLQTAIQQLEKLVPTQEREGKRLHELTLALMVAMREGHLEAAETLLNVKGVETNVAFLEILCTEKPVDFLELFARHGRRRDELWAPVHRVPPWYDAIPSRLDVLAWLLAHGADATDDERVKRPLDWAVAHRSIPAIRILIDHGADIKLIDALHTAAGSAYCHPEDPQILEVMQYLLSEHGVDINARSSRGDTALHRAIGMRSRSRVSFLLNHGADLNVEDTQGRTPTQFAVVFAKNLKLDAEHYRDIADLLVRWEEQGTG